MPAVTKQGLRGLGGSARTCSYCFGGAAHLFLEGYLF